MNARPYQQEAIASSLAKFDAGEQRTLVVLPTGCGKTIVAGYIAKTFLERGSGRVMALAHRDELIRQAADKFQKVTGIRASIEKGEEWSDEDGLLDRSRIVASSFQTQNSGKKPRMQRFKPEDFDLLWIDEAHHALAPSYRKVIDYYAQGNPDLKILMVTATADRGDGQGMGQVCESVAYRYDLPDAIADGWLVGIRQLRVALADVDFSRVGTVAGDFNLGELDAELTREKPLHGVAQATIEAACGLKQHSLQDVAGRDDRTSVLSTMIGEGRRRKTLVFTVSVFHAQRLAEIFNRWQPGSAGYVDGEMELDARRKVFSDFAAGRLQYLCNCMVATEGYDEPGIELVVCARPTKSRALYAQQVGRGTRPLTVIADDLGKIEIPAMRRAMIEQSDKPHCLVLDFVGNSGQHKLINAADLLGGEQFDPSVVDRAAEIAGEDGANVEDALAEAQRQIEMEWVEDAEQAEDLDALDLQRATAEAMKRASLVGTVTYDVREVDAFNTRDTSARRQSTPVAANGATEGQVSYLVRLGVARETAMGYGKRQASAVISSMLAKQQKSEVA